LFSLGLVGSEPKGYHKRAKILPFLEKKKTSFGWDHQKKTEKKSALHGCRRKRVKKRFCGGKKEEKRPFSFSPARRKENKVPERGQQGLNFPFL